MFLNNYHYILLNYTLVLVLNVLNIIYLCTLSFIYKISKWSTTLKYYFFSQLFVAAVSVFGIISVIRYA